MPFYQCINDNIDALLAVQQLLDQLDNSDYCAIREKHFSSSVGDHVRHILDHYQCFFVGLDKGHINYDLRTRDAKVSTDKNHASEQITTSIEAFRQLQLNEPQQDISVTLKTSNGIASDKPVPSTVARELIFLHGHSTHHFSLIAIILKLLNHAIDDTFGVAPSTRAYEQLLAQDAPRKCAH